MVIDYYSKTLDLKRSLHLYFLCYVSKLLIVGMVAHILICGLVQIRLTVVSVVKLLIFPCIFRIVDLVQIEGEAFSLKNAFQNLLGLI